MDVHRLRKSLLTVVGCAAIALAAPLAASVGAGPAKISAVPCSSSKLVVWLPSGLGSGAAGSVYYKLRVTNLGAACTVSGFPKLSALDLQGKPVGKPASKEPGKKATAVKLAPGGSASFQLRVVAPGVFSPADCHPAKAAGLRVSPPGAGGSKVVPLPFETCAKPTQTVLSVGPMTKS
jgi:uncharacterized protein DUF4232